MLKRTVKSLICLLFIVALTAGCWDSLDVEDRDICTAVIVDKTEKGYAFIVEIAGISATVHSVQAEQAHQPGLTAIVKSEGKNFAAARRELDRRLNKPIYLGAVQTLFLTEKMAKDGIEEYVYRVRQLNEYRQTMDVAVTPDDPEKFLKISPANASSVGFAVAETLRNLHESGRTFHMTLADLLQKLASKNPAYLMASLSERDKQIAMTGYCVFQGDKCIGTIPVEEATGVNLILGDPMFKPEVVLQVDGEETDITLQVTLTRHDIEAQYSGGKIMFKLDYAVEALIMFLSEPVPLTGKRQKELEDKLKEVLMKEFRDALEMSQKKYACDYMSFSRPFRIAYPDEYEKMDWKEEFPKAGFEVDIDVKITEDPTIELNPEQKE